MSSYVNKKIVCKCCNKEYEARLLRGWSQNYPADLDLNPHNPAVYDETLVCPHCGYAASRLYDAVDEKIVQAVNSEVYKSIWTKPQYDEVTKKLMAAAYLAEVSGKWKEAGTQYLKAAWHFQELQQPEEMVAREKVIQCFRAYLEETPDVECAMAFIDSLRQAGEFEEAKETAESLAPYLVGNGLLCDILQYEQKLIAAEDDLPHSVSEV